MNNPPKYLCIGHVCMDVGKDGSYMLGGTASYASKLASKLGCEVSVLTSYGEDFLFENNFESIKLINTGE